MVVKIDFRMFRCFILGVIVLFRWSRLTRPNFEKVRHNVGAIFITS